jgi:gas vesicle protein
MADENHGFAGSSLIFFFTMGGLIGAALATLYAPWEGRQTRVKVKELAEEVKNLANRYSTALKEKGSGFLEKGKEIEVEREEPLSSNLDIGTTQPE